MTGTPVCDGKGALTGAPLLLAGRPVVILAAGQDDGPAIRGITARAFAGKPYASGTEADLPKGWNRRGRWPFRCCGLVGQG